MLKVLQGLLDVQGIGSLCKKLFCIESLDVGCSENRSSVQGCWTWSRYHVLDAGDSALAFCYCNTLCAYNGLLACLWLGSVLSPPSCTLRRCTSGLATGYKGRIATLGMAGPSTRLANPVDAAQLLGDDDDGDISSRYRNVHPTVCTRTNQGLRPQSHLSPPLSRTPPAESPGLSGTPSPLRSPRPQRPISPALHDHEPRPLSNDTGRSIANGHLSSHKDVADWYIEGPGKRVGYDDLTAIDWIFEYAKERQRLRTLLSGSHGFGRTVKQLADASHVWVVLITTGVVVGFVAAGINIASDWLGDIKQGYCKTGDDGGRFYLNRQFCCWGHDDDAQCQDWTPWRTALGVSSPGGGYIVEYILFVLFSVVFAISAGVLVKQYSTYAKHSGIPEIKTVLGGFVMRRFLGAWTLITKSLGLCLAVASGLWVGKEGPLVHVACCCANIIMKPFTSISQNEARKREVLSAAAASGISVAFGSPIGGVLFSLEQLSYYFPDKTMWQSFVCAMVAAVTLQALNPFHTGKIVLYQVQYTTGWHSFEIVPFVLLGILGGIFGGLFTRLNMLVTRFRRSDHNPLREKQLLEVLAIAILTALINFPNNFMRAQLSELVYYLFAECATIGNHDIFGLCKATTAGSLSMASLLVTASGLGFLLASITFGLPIPAGIILPSLALGALSGRALGVTVEVIHKHFSDSIIFATCEADVPCITPGTYAIVGAAAALAGVTRLTISIVVIMFELTGALTYVLPIMVAVMLAKWIGDAISKRGIYEAWIHLNEYPYLDNKDDTHIPHVPVSNIMTNVADMTCLDTSRAYSVSELRKILSTTPYRGYPVITLKGPDGTGAPTTSFAQKPEKNTLLGYVSRTELLFALDNPTSVEQQVLSDGRLRSPATRCYFTYNAETAAGEALDLRPWIDQTPVTLNAASSFQLAVSMFQNLGLRYLLLVERGAFRGILTKKDVWWILNATEDAKRSDSFVPGTGVLRESHEPGDQDTEGQGEGEGLLQRAQRDQG
jgi:chloride channel 3/4/5